MVSASMRSMQSSMLVVNFLTSDRVKVSGRFNINEIAYAHICVIELFSNVGLIIECADS
jgi:uncharacterized protein (DUF39 family)